MRGKSQAIGDYIQELKGQNPIGKMVENKNEYRIWILHPGEDLFYQQGDKALICEVQIRKSQIIWANTIKAWDDGSEVTSDEKAIILQRLGSYFTNYQNVEVIIQDT